MDLEKAYNKIDNFCCLNHIALQGEKIKHLNNEEEIINMFKHYQETKLDEEYCKDVLDMVKALETIKQLVDLQKEIVCPLDAVIKLINAKRIIRDDGVVFGFIGINFNDENKLILYNDDECNTFTSDLRLADYKKTWWLKEDRSE